MKKVAKAASYKGPRLRLLPVLIFLAVLMLSVRIGQVWTGVEETMETVSVSVGHSQAIAQEGPSDGGRPVSPATGLTGPQLAQARTDGTDAGGAGGIVGQQLAQATEAAAPPEDGVVPEGGAGEGQPVVGGGESDALPPMGAGRDNPAAFTQSEIDLLQRLAERREQLDARDRELEQREAMLTAAEGRIDRKINELKSLEESIQSLLVQQDEAERQKIVKLVNIYGNMKPKDAARIFNDMEMPLLVNLLLLMKDRTSAPILAEMDSAKARAVTIEMSQQQPISMPDQGTGG